MTGLDTLRALAITLVYAFHYKVFVSEESTFGWVSDIGWIGVDLFFVLSGYLIANQLFDRDLHVGRFYIRRALRTLPNYLVVLSLYVALPGRLGGGPLPPLWRFLTFTQNWWLEAGTAFSHAWSLCIEEQFYLMLPLVVLAAVRWKWSLKRCWALMLMAVGAAIAWRSIQWAHHGGADEGRSYMRFIYYSSWCRLDEFLPGVAVAMLKHSHPTLWATLMARGRFILGVSTVATSVLLWALTMTYQFSDGSHGYFMTGFGYSLLAICFGGLSVAAISPASALARWRIPGAATLATMSYALYLTHKAVGHVMKTSVLASFDVIATSWFGVVVIALACGLVAWVLHVLVEKPALKWRDRQWPARMHASTSLASQPQPRAEVA